MDKLKEQSTENKTKKEENILSKIKKALRTAERNNDKKALLFDILLFSIGFVLSRCHLFFGARPAAIAFVALLPTGVWPTLMGAVIGGLTMGVDGIIFAAASVVTVLLRAAVSSGDKDALGRRVLFGENLLTRMCIALLSGFITAVYEVLLSGLNETTLVFGLVMILVTPILTFGLSGLVSQNISAEALINCKTNPLTLSDGEQNERYDKIFFQFSSLLLIFMISLSFKGVNLMGISVSYVFSALTSLLIAKRFGAMRGAAVGFISSLGISAEFSVAFALMGLGAGIMFGFGTAYAVIIGGVALCAWSIYTGGMNGLLSTFPEYAIAAAIAAPICSKITVTEEPEKKESSTDTSEDMVGTMALCYQSKYQGSTDALADTLNELSALISSGTGTSARLRSEEYRDIVVSVAERNCIGCYGSSLCAREDIRPCIKNADRIAEALYKESKITPEHINTDTEFCQKAEIISSEINEIVAKEEKRRFALSEKQESGAEYRLISALISQLQAEDRRECTVNNNLTAPLTEAFESCGFKNGTIRAFGDRKSHFILAGEDEGGSKITSFELRKSIENAAGVRLGAPEYFKRDSMVLMECDARPRYKASYAIAHRPGNDSEVSGDTAVCFKSKNDYFYSLISDGMGSGELAKGTSVFTADFIKSTSRLGGINESLIHILNHSLRIREEECSATVDLFELDLLNGKGIFIKSGAAPSYVKRGSSLFRVRSKTAPLGLLHSVDTEKIRLEIKGGDYIIMLSDGIADASEDAPWLLLLLGDSPKENLQEYAELILAEAVKNSTTHDDMTVSIIRIEEE